MKVCEAEVCERLRQFSDGGRERTTCKHQVFLKKKETKRQCNRNCHSASRVLQKKKKLKKITMFFLFFLSVAKCCFKTKLDLCILQHGEPTKQKKKCTEEFRDANMFDHRRTVNESKTLTGYFFCSLCQQILTEEDSHETTECRDRSLFTLEGSESQPLERAPWTEGSTGNGWKRNPHPIVTPRTLPPVISIVLLSWVKRTIKENVSRCGEGKEEIDRGTDGYQFARVPNLSLAVEKAIRLKENTLSVMKCWKCYNKYTNKNKFVSLFFIFYI